MQLVRGKKEIKKKKKSWRSNIQKLGVTERRENTKAGNPIEFNTISKN